MAEKQYLTLKRHLTNALRFWFLPLVACFVVSSFSAGQWLGRQTDCYADSIAANPNRPTVANPADTTQYGVLELEYGWDRQWQQANFRQTSFGGLLKFGLLCDLELRWGTTSFISETDPSGTHRTFGDNWLGPQIRVYKQTKLVPSLAFSYAGKIPSASTEAELGSGHTDHAFTFLASKDVRKFHFDFNFTKFLIGRVGSGFDSNQQTNLTFAHVLRGGLQLTGEFYGQSQLNSSTPGFASSLWALTYNVSPRLVIDGGFEAGLSSRGPHRHVFAGATYSIANFYAAFRDRRTRARTTDQSVGRSRYP